MNLHPAITDQPRLIARWKETQTMTLLQKLSAIFALAGFAAVPVFAQMEEMPGGAKMPAKSPSAKATPEKMAMCCLGSMKMGTMMSEMTSAEKKKMGKCCMSGMKPAGMKVSGMKSAGMKMGKMKMDDSKMSKMMSGMSASDKGKMGKCCMSGMKDAGLKPDSMKPGKMKMGNEKKP